MCPSKAYPEKIVHRTNTYEMNNNPTISIGCRRYIGCKAKLVDWIFDIINAETSGIQSFCDIFAGTAIVSEAALQKYNHVIVNDFLYSNQVIYKGFWEEGDFCIPKLQEQIDNYNSLHEGTLSDNFFSKNYGGKYFENLVARKIGFIRQDIEDNKSNLSDKEYFILLASLIYSIDKLANTLGHFEAYIKKEIKYRPLTLKLIDAKSCANVEIHQEDSNDLAKHINADLVYVDPPYNSRQYSRFYHVYETLVKWDNPELHGVAMKPKEENMSKYCSSKAPEAFADLISNLKAKYIVVSYNNTYHSKSSSSRNKISLEQITSILNKKGDTKIFEHEHPFFNAGKTEFDNHKELLFVTKVHEI